MKDYINSLTIRVYTTQDQPKPLTDTTLKKNTYFDTHYNLPYLLSSAILISIDYS